LKIGQRLETLEAKIVYGSIFSGHGVYVLSTTVDINGVKVDYSTRPCNIVANSQRSWWIQATYFVVRHV